MNNITFPCEVSNLNSLANYSTNFPGPGLTVSNQEFLYLSDYEKKTSDTTQGWTYKLNQYGYRGELTTIPGIKTIGFFGCSVTVGIGVEEKNTFVSLVGARLEMNVINFGNQGSSIQRIAKLIVASIRVIDFDSVVITLPNFTRFIVADDADQLHCINPAAIKPQVEKKYKAVFENFTDADFLYYASDSIQWIISELKLKNIKAYWTSWSPHTSNILEKFVPADNIVPHMFVNDHGRDGAHPGILSHRLHADNIINKYLEDEHRKIKNAP
jgi:hypothetical protein